MIDLRALGRKLASTEKAVPGLDFFQSPARRDEIRPLTAEKELAKVSLGTQLFCVQLSNEAQPRSAN